MEHEGGRLCQDTMETPFHTLIECVTAMRRANIFAVVSYSQRISLCVFFFFFVVLDWWGLCRINLAGERWHSKYFSLQCVISLNMLVATPNPNSDPEMPS